MVNFDGETVVCIGSGHSLTELDCELVGRSGLSTIVLNSSWVRAPFAKVLYGGDSAWWDANFSHITIPAEKWTSSPTAQVRYKLHFFRSPTRNWHSGLRAVELAESLGAKKVLLLGYDCRIDYGTHWHEDHKATQNPTRSVCKEWCAQFAGLARRTKIEIINCSRDTALTCFPRAKLEDSLCLKRSQVETHHKTNLNSGRS